MPKVKTRQFDQCNLFFTSDIHFNHKFITGIRGFETKDEMNKELIVRWNTTVGLDSDVFILGDVSFGNSADTMEFLSMLNGRLHLIRGNHDKGLSAGVLAKFETIAEQAEIDVIHGDDKHRIMMSHYSMQVWNRSAYGSYHLFGHSHGTLEGIGKSMDVGMDTHSLCPYHFLEVDELLSKKELVSKDYHGERV